MSKRCQICDGPVVNGRCKLCGMPYRNDEVLYHLNENRSEHYRHATPKARELMRRMEGTQKDKKTEKIEKPEKTNTKAYAKTNTKTNTKINTKTNTKTPAKTSTWVAVLICAVIILCALIPNFIEYGREKINERMFDYEIGDIDENTIPDDVLYTYTLFSDGEEMIIGETIPAGKYLAVIGEGSAVICVSTNEGTGMYSLTEEEPQIYLNLEEGAVVFLGNTEHEWEMVEFFQCSLDSTRKSL